MEAQYLWKINQQVKFRKFEIFGSGDKKFINLKMKIVFDDGKSILKQLINLYNILPEDLRTKSDKLPASELIFEATE